MLFEPAFQTFLSLGAFYAADARRRRSRERDVGLWWRSAGVGPTFRAAWVRDTGELYLFQHGLTGAGGGQVVVVAEVPDEEALDDLLDGWESVCGERGSLDWLCEHLELDAGQRELLHGGRVHRPAAAALRGAARSAWAKRASPAPSTVPGRMPSRAG